MGAIVPRSHHRGAAAADMLAPAKSAGRLLAAQRLEMFGFMHRASSMPRMPPALRHVGACLRSTIPRAAVRVGSTGAASEVPADPGSGGGQVPEPRPAQIPSSASPSCAGHARAALLEFVSILIICGA